jgi:hypothetical protein
MAVSATKAPVKGTADNPLEGDALLTFLEGNADLSQSAKAVEAGYYTTVTDKEGKEIQRPRVPAFHQAILRAKGVDLLGERRRPSARGRGLVRCNKQGVTPVSNYYTRHLGIEAGDYVRVEVDEDDGIVILSKGDANDQAEETTD